MNPQTTRRPSGRRFVPPVLAFAAMAGFALASCGETRALGVELGELRALLGRGEGGILLEVPEKRYAELERLGPGAFHYAARLAARLGSPERSLVLLRLAFEREDGLHRERARELLLDALVDSGDDGALAAFVDGLAKEADASSAGSATDAFPPGAVELEARAAALARLGRHAEALVALDAIFASWPERLNAPALRALEAASALELEQDSARGVEALRAVLASGDAGRAELSKAKALAAALPEGSLDALERMALEVRAAVAAGDQGAAIRLADANLEALAGALVQDAALSDLGRAFLALKEHTRAEAFFARVAASAAAAPTAAGAPRAAFLAAFYRARILRERERHAAAAAAFSEAAALAERPADRDACLWYHVDALSRLSRADAIRALDESTPELAAPGNFTDLMDGLVRASLVARDGAAIRTIATGFGLRAPAAARARLYWTLARAAEAGFVPGFDTPADRRAFALPLYHEVAALSREHYYLAFSAAMTGEAAWAFVPEPAPVEAPPSAPAGPAVTAIEKPAFPDTSELTYLLGFAEWGMPDLVYAELRELTGWDALSPAAYRVLAGRLADEGLWSDSMLAASRLWYLGGYAPTRRDWELLWPRPWLDEIRAAAAAASVPDRFLLGLVRSESHFRPAVVSSAGAIGLAQFMPATAAEAAKALGMTDYDLTRPEDNLRLAGRHLAGLTRALSGDLPRVAAAYNAGLSRPRAWDREFGDLPVELWIEAIPFPETRQYVKNVLGAAVLYGALHEGLDGPLDLVALLGME
ncbi:MAG: lytic transglycosylase domain-containing protein [Spirochaetales bacterium]|nr:lytic transglycosylase domain-containing protein [Spirochaetales bacterium]